MKQYDEMNQRLKALNNRLQLPEIEKNEVLTKINQNMDNDKRKQITFQWKYYLATAATLVLIFIIAIPFFSNPKNELVNDHGTNLVTGGNDDNPPVSEPTEDEIIIRVMNYTPYDIEQLYVKVYQSGSMTRSQGGMYADGSPIKPGDTLDFQFYDYELGQGEIELEMDIHLASSEVYTAPKMSLLISEEKIYYLKLGSESNTSYYLIEDEDKLELDINNETVEMLREKVDLSATKSQIENLLGENYRVWNSELNGSETWKYDHGAIEGYQSPTEFYYEEDFIEIQNGAVEAILSFTWNENDELESFTALYVDSGDGNIYGYYLFFNGLEKLEFVY